jgi:hypothetical protein
MGYKLGTMVKLFNSLVIFFLVISVNADPLGQIEKNLNLKQIKPFTDVEAQIYSIRASKDDLSLIKTKIAKPTAHSLEKHRLISSRDQFALRVLDKDRKEVLLLGLGNPFYIHAQHIGYENSNVFGGYIEQDFDVALPVNIDASYLVLLSQDSEGLKIIKEIKTK